MNNNFRMSTLSLSVSLALASGLAVTSNSAFAQEGASELDRIEVTGSRIKRTDIEGPSPVTVISREDIDLSGYDNVADILRQTTFNSFGSFQERSGSSFGQIALVDLRGLGSDRSVVLLNGRRQPFSPFTGNSVNLNTIPIAAIERIEILTDSASAVYGSDAIGGVINIILRKDFEGAELGATIARPTRDGGDEASGNVVLGTSSDRSRFVFTAEWFDREEVFDRDRPYSRAVGTPGVDQLGVTTRGINEVGNTAWFAFSDGRYEALPCDPAIFAGVFDFPPVPGDTACGFAYANISAQTGGLKRLSTFLSFEYDLNSDHTFYYQNVSSRNQTFGRYAPAAGGFVIQADAPLNTFGEPFVLFHRFVGHGPRDDNTRAYEFDNMMGLKGTFGGTIDYDWYIRSFKAESVAIGTGYVLSNVIGQLVAAGQYDFLNPLAPSNQRAIDLSTAEVYRDLKNDTWQTGLTLTGDAFEMANGPAGWAAGFEYEDTRFQDIYDSYRRAFNVIGTAGGSASGERDRYAVFGEMVFPLLANFDIQVAGRYDDYSDFGNKFTPQLSMRWQPIDSLLLRASVGKGFRAPSLRNLFSARTQSFNNVTDFLLCRQQGIPDSQCPSRQVENFGGGNPGLTAETSKSFNFGFLWEPLDNYYLGMDIYRVEVDNAIQGIGLATLLALELEGQPLPPGTEIRRGPSGVIEFIQGGQANVATRNVEGWDIRFGGSHNLDWGNLSWGTNYSRILSYDFSGSPDAPTNNIINLAGLPKHRANTNVRWSQGDYTLNYNLNWISGYLTRAGRSDPRKIGGYVQHDITGVWNAPWNAEVKLGVRNVANKLPPVDPITGFQGTTGFELDLYPVYGRTPFVSYQQRF